MMLRTRPVNELAKTTSPIAMQNRGPAQETDVHSLCPSQCGWTSGWTDQLLPFQRSARIDPGPAGLPTRPTAVHALGDVHATAFNTPSSGEGSTVQLAALAGAANHSAIATTMPAIPRAPDMPASLAGEPHARQGAVLALHVGGQRERPAVTAASIRAEQAKSTRDGRSGRTTRT